jgi:stage IV sporulation protein FB
MKIKWNRLKFSPLFLLLLMAVIFGGYFFEFILMFISILIHEIGHIIAALLLGRNIKEFKILHVGTSVKIQNDLYDKRGNYFIFFCGPFFSFLLILMGYFLVRIELFEFLDIDFFITCNFCILVLNILPIMPMDGGQILMNFLLTRIGLFHSYKILKIISQFFCFIILILGIIQLIENKYNLSLFFIGIYMLYELRKEELEVLLMSSENFIFRYSRIKKKGIYAARDLVVMKHIKLSDVLKHMDFDRFHIIHVLDDGLKLLEVLTEQDVIDGLTKYNSEITFEEYINEGKTCMHIS